MNTCTNCGTEPSIYPMTDVLVVANGPHEGHHAVDDDGEIKCCCGGALETSFSSEKGEISSLREKIDDLESEVSKLEDLNSDNVDALDELRLSKTNMANRVIHVEDDLRKLAKDVAPYGDASLVDAIVALADRLDDAVGPCPECCKETVDPKLQHLQIVVYTMVGGGAFGTTAARSPARLLSSKGKAVKRLLDRKPDLRYGIEAVAAAVGALSDHARTLGLDPTLLPDLPDFGTAGGVFR